MQDANDTDRIAELETERLMLRAALRMALNYIRMYTRPTTLGYYRVTDTAQTALDWTRDGEPLAHVRARVEYAAWLAERSD